MLKRNHKFRSEATRPDETVAEIINKGLRRAKWRIFHRRLKGCCFWQAEDFSSNFRESGLASLIAHGIFEKKKNPYFHLAISTPTG